MTYAQQIDDVIAEYFYNHGYHQEYSSWQEIQAILNPSYYDIIIWLSDVKTIHMDIKSQFNSITGLHRKYYIKISQPIYIQDAQTFYKSCLTNEDLGPYRTLDNAYKEACFYLMNNKLL